MPATVSGSPQPPALQQMPEYGFSLTDDGYSHGSRVYKHLFKHEGRVHAAEDGYGIRIDPLGKLKVLTASLM